MRLEQFAELGESRSIDALRSAMVELTSNLDFEKFALSLAVPQSDDRLQWSDVSNVPEDYRDDWTDPSLGRVCPVMQHARRSNNPLIWDRRIYLENRADALWEKQASFGYATGFLVAAHLPNGSHVVLGIDRRAPLQESSDRLAHKLALFQLFATCAIDPCVATLGRQIEDQPCMLTKREIECLQWTFASKTAWEVARLLAISERTATHHINNAMHKLGCSSKYAAALKAHRHGWIL